MYGKKIIQHYPDILVLDTTMPNLSRFKVSKQVHAFKNLMNIPITFLSAKIEQVEILKNRSLGLKTLIEKPDAFDLLLSKIKIMMNESGTGR